MQEEKEGGGRDDKEGTYLVLGQEGIQVVVAALGLWKGGERREGRLVGESTREEREVGLCTYRCGAARRLLGPHAALDALRGDDGAL